MREAAQQIERIAHGNWDREPLLPLGKLLGFAELKCLQQQQCIDIFIVCWCSYKLICSGICFPLPTKSLKAWTKHSKTIAFSMFKCFFSALDFKCTAVCCFLSLVLPRFFFPGPAVGIGDGAPQLGVNFDAAPCLQNLWRVRAWAEAYLFESRVRARLFHLQGSKSSSLGERAAAGKAASRFPPEA